MEKPEKKEVSEKAMKERKKPGRKPMGSDVYEFHLSVRVAQSHFDILDRLIGRKDKSRGEIVRDMIENYGHAMDEREAKNVKSQ